MLQMTADICVQGDGSCAVHSVAPAALLIFGEKYFKPETCSSLAGGSLPQPFTRISKQEKIRNNDMTHDIKLG